MWRRVNSFSVLWWTWGDVGGSGSRGTSAAQLTARKESSSEAVTRDAEVQRGRRRIVLDYVRLVWEAWRAVVVLPVDGGGRVR